MLICVLGRPCPNARQPDNLPFPSLSATVIGLCSVLMMQPSASELHFREMLSPPVSSALTPLLEMNSTASGRVKSRAGCRSTCWMLRALVLCAPKIVPSQHRT